jgi:replicative superfamily II helicase
MVLGKLLYDIVLGIPVTISKKTMEGLRDAADKERLITEESVKQKLQELQLQLQEGEMSEEQYEELEIQLIDRLKAIREYRSQGGA